MTISLECKCGRKLQVAQNLAGKMAQCPACGRAVRVPLPAAPVSPPVEDGEAAGGPPLAQAPTSPAAQSKPRKKRSSSDREHVLGMAILGAVMIVMTFAAWGGYRFLQTYPERSKARAAADLLLNPNASDQDLLRWGRTALPALREDLRDRDPKRQLQAVKLLGAMGPTASAATPDLIDVLTQSKNPQVKVCAAETLTRLGAKEAIPQLLGEITHADPGVRAAAIRAVVMLGGREAQPAIPLFMAVLESDRALAPRIAAAEALGIFGAAAAEAIPELVQAFDSTDDDLSSAAIRALGRIDPADPIVLPTLIRALKKDATLGDAAQALAMMGPPARTATPDLLQALPRAELLDRQHTTRRAASSNPFELQQMRWRRFRATETEAVEAALERVADGELAEVIAARKTQQVELVRAALKSPDSLVRRVAAEALSNWPGGAPVAENGGSD